MLVPTINSSQGQVMGGDGKNEKMDTSGPNEFLQQDICAHLSEGREGRGSD